MGNCSISCLRSETMHWTSFPPEILKGGYKNTLWSASFIFGLHSMAYPHCWNLWHCERKYPRLRSKGMWSEGQYRGPVSKIKHLRARKIPSGLRAKFQPAARARIRVRPSTPGQACRGDTPRSQAAPRGGVRLSRPARPAPRERGRREAWPAAGPSRALPPPSPLPLSGPQARAQS